MDPDPTPDPTPFFIDLKDAKKYLFFFIFFSYNLPTGTSSQPKKINFLLKFCRHYLSTLNTFMRKGKDPEPNPYL